MESLSSSGLLFFHGLQTNLKSRRLGIHSPSFSTNTNWQVDTINKPSQVVNTSTCPMLPGYWSGF
uniref:Uncharacterized protein n=1 Tax=Arundo donax TaxID=35708 RepID=A0A0A9G0L6_ARUDO